MRSLRNCWYKIWDILPAVHLYTLTQHAIGAHSIQKTLIRLLGDVIQISQAQNLWTIKRWGLGITDMPRHVTHMCVACCRNFATTSSDVMHSFRIITMKFLSRHICYHISISRLWICIFSQVCSSILLTNAPLNFCTFHTCATNAPKITSIAV